MKVFIVGHPKSGKSTVARSLAQEAFDRKHECYYLDAIGWVKKTFRQKQIDESESQYYEAYHEYFMNRLQINPRFILDNIQETTDAHGLCSCNWVIDGIFSPKEFSELFDYKNDVVVFLNRTDNSTDIKDYEAVGISVMRDYCFWLSSANLLPKSRWLEYNFKIPGEDSDSVKMLGSKNTVYIVKSINTVIDHLIKVIRNLQQQE
jgi:adenylate kinase family enzyme